MKIEKILIQNFYSFKNETLDLSDYSGITVIKGKNLDTGASNGAGKRVLIEAIYFGLTGKTIRKSTEDSLVNNQANKKCVVELHLTHNGEAVRIVRQKKTTKLEFFVGEENKTQAGVIDTQREIDSFLNINHKVLLASMFFGQSNDVSFLDCTADDKRTIIRNFLNLDDIFQMRDKIKAHKSTFYQGMKEKDAIIADNTKNIKKIDGKLLELNQAQMKYSSYTDDVLALSLEDILDAEQAVREFDDKYSANVSFSKSARFELNYANEVIEADGKMSETCYECGAETGDGQPLDVEEYKIRKIKYTAEINKYKEANNLLLAVPAPPISSREFSKIQGYKDLCSAETNYEEMKKDLVESITEAQNLKDTQKTWYEVMRFWEKAFSEQGVLKHIISNILDYFNERCNYYLSYLTNSKYSIKFDDELTEKIETNGKHLWYISLSGGEKRKMNLAVMLGLKDLLLLTDKSHMDLLFFDEVAENIDDEGIDGLHQLLLELKKSKTIFVITHNKYLKTLLDSSPRLSIIKHKGTSQIK